LRVPAGQGHGERWLTADAFRQVEERAQQVLTDFFSAHRMRDTMPRAEAVSAILPGRAAQLAPAYLRFLKERKVLEIRGDRVSLPGRAADLTGGESKLAAQILAVYEGAGLMPPPPGEVSAALGAKAKIVDGVVNYLIEQAKLARLPGGLLISEAAIAGARGQLEASGKERITVPEFKDLFGLTRKWAIPLLEHLDSIGATRRLGNERQILRRSSSNDR